MQTGSTNPKQNNVLEQRIVIKIDISVARK